MSRMKQFDDTDEQFDEWYAEVIEAWTIEYEWHMLEMDRLYQEAMDDY